LALAAVEEDKKRQKEFSEAQIKHIKEGDKIRAREMAHVDVLPNPLPLIQTAPVIQPIPQTQITQSKEFIPLQTQQRQFISEPIIQTQNMQQANMPLNQFVPQTQFMPEPMMQSQNFQQPNISLNQMPQNQLPPQAQFMPEPMIQHNNMPVNQMAQNQFVPQAQFIPEPMIQAQNLQQNNMPFNQMAQTQSAPQMEEIPEQINRIEIERTVTIMTQPNTQPQTLSKEHFISQGPIEHRQEAELRPPQDQIREPIHQNVNHTVPVDTSDIRSTLDASKVIYEKLVQNKIAGSTEIEQRN